MRRSSHCRCRKPPSQPGPTQSPCDQERDDCSRLGIDQDVERSPEEPECQPGGDIQGHGRTRRSPSLRISGAPPSTRPSRSIGVIRCRRLIWLIERTLSVIPEITPVTISNGVGYASSDADRVRPPWPSVITAISRDLTKCSRGASHRGGQTQTTCDQDDEESAAYRTKVNDRTRRNR